MVDDPTNNYPTARRTGVGATFHKITVPAGTRHLRVSLFDEETDGNDDLDLFVFAPNGSVVSSGGSTSAERVDIARPAPGDYVVMVHGYATDGPDANYTLFSWVIPPAAGGNFNVSGPPPGGAGAVTLNWFGLAADVRYMGDIGYADANGEVGHTLVTIAPGPQTSLALSSPGAGQSEPGWDEREGKAGAGVRVLEYCAAAECGPESQSPFRGESGLASPGLTH